MHGKRIDLRRAQGDDAADQVGPAHGQHLRKAAAAALTDGDGALALLLDDALEPLSSRSTAAPPQFAFMRIPVRQGR